MSKKRLDWDDCRELAMELTGSPDDLDELLEELLESAYGINLEGFADLVNDLLDLVVVGKESNGFATSQRWLVKKRNKNPKNPSCPKSKFSDEDMETAKLLETEIRKNLPDFKTPNLKSWANEIRIMREQDGRTIPEIRKRILFAANDPFWKSNILSAAKLRKQYDQLTLKMQEKRQDGVSRTDSEEERLRAKYSHLG